MIKTIVGRYLLFGILGVEALLLPFFLSKEVYGEVEFYKFTAFLSQFLLFGAGTGYVVRYIKAPFQYRERLTTNFCFFASIQAFLIAAIVYIFEPWYVALIAFFAMLAIVFESTIKVREKYLLAMSFKPLLSLVLICLLPLLLVLEWHLKYYLVIAFFLAISMYIAIAEYAQVFSKADYGSLSTSKFLGGMYKYTKNISSGFVMNFSTAMMFIFFYIDRAIVREKFPALLADYSLSYSIMQLTIVAITTFSYVNLVEFGKNQTDKGFLKKNIYSSFKKCMILYLIIGGGSIVFSYGAEYFYDYDQVFETTCLMVVLFGLANVFGSLNAAHLYLGSVNVMTLMMLGTILISVALNWFLPLSTLGDYYILLGKTYVLYLVFSILSCVYIVLKLRNTTENIKE